MYMTKDDFNSICKALLLLPDGDDFDRLTFDEQKTILEAVAVMVELSEKRKKDNARSKAYMKEKRKNDPKYFRRRM